MDCENMNPNAMVNKTNIMEVIFCLDGRSSAQKGKVDKKMTIRTHGTPAVIVSTEMLNTHSNLTLGSILCITVPFCS